MNNLVIIGIVAIIGYYILKNNTLIRVGGDPAPAAYKQVLYWRQIVSYYKKLYAPNIPTEIILAIIAQETMGKIPDGSGSSGEVGIMQITPMGLSWSGAGYDISQVKNDQNKNIQTGCMHLQKDFQYLNGSVDYAIMAYNIARSHIKNLINGVDTAADRQKIETTGKSYLGKVTIHKKVIQGLLFQYGIDDLKSENYIPFKPI